MQIKKLTGINAYCINFIRFIAFSLAHFLICKVFIVNLAYLLESEKPLIFSNICNHWILLWLFHVCCWIIPAVQNSLLARIGKKLLVTTGDRKHDDDENHKNIPAQPLKSTFIRLKMESVAVKWRVASGSHKLSNSENFKDIFISSDLTRKQAEKDRKLRLKLKEICIKGEVENCGRSGWPCHLRPLRSTGWWVSKEMYIG